MHQVCLRVEEGHGYVQGDRIPLQRSKILIGRKSGGSKLDVHFSNPYISRKHAVILCEDGMYTITNLKSKHGLDVNGYPLDPFQQTVLCDQDVISLAKGAVKLTFINQAETEHEKTRDLVLEQELFKICREKRRVYIQGEPLQLNGKDMELLLLLDDNCDRVVLYEEIKKQIWPERFTGCHSMPDMVDQEELTALVYRLRKKLGSAGEKIITVPRTGYMLEK
ncbi:FHA domain-containing protein [Bacillus mangrovi]|uniref:FHA domain-containing protein n=1 Tax=Metabacillus mangrovi TaxID=1491830 RepID=A0A7X2S8M8_9BACI|nr:FHA domain-containing protein [Metabacillus mangrovi]MTH55402.1 FHA domain-containing protein [Metabacillus mangrovi]